MLVNLFFLPNQIQTSDNVQYRWYLQFPWSGECWVKVYYQQILAWKDISKMTASLRNWKIAFSPNSIFPLEKDFCICQSAWTWEVLPWIVKEFYCWRLHCFRWGHKLDNLFPIWFPKVTQRTNCIHHSRDAAIPRGLKFFDWIIVDLQYYISLNV